MPTSAKDLCFEAAILAYQKLLGGLPGGVELESQLPWVKDALAPNAQWQPARGLFKHIWAVMAYARQEMGLPSPAVRFPDITATFPDGKSLVLDTKFTNANGGIDPWGKNANKLTGQRQLDSYKEINRQQGKLNMDEPSLDKNKCKCAEKQKKGELQQREVTVFATQPSTAPYFVVLPNGTQVEIPTIELPEIPPIFELPVLPEFVP